MTAKEIVVRVDDSLAARAALRWTAEYRGSTGAVLRGIHVVDSCSSPRDTPPGSWSASQKAPPC
jgi:nucleotide-binding universal stress UspA family protein